MPLLSEFDQRAQRARYSVSVFFLGFGFLVGSWLPHIPDIKRQIGCNDAQLGGALLGSGLGAVMSMQFAGWLIRRVGSKWVALGGGLSTCVFITGLMLHSSLLGLAVNLVILGICYGFLDVGMNSHSVEVQALFHRPILASVHGFFSLGGILGGLGASAFAYWSAPPESHLICAAFAILLAMGFATPFLLPADTDKGGEGPRFMIPKGALLALGILCLFAFLGEGAIMDWAPLYLRESLRASPIFAGIVTSLCSGAMAIGRFMGDATLHRFGDRKVVAVGGATWAVGLIVASSSSSIWLCLFSLTVGSLGLANAAPVLFREAGNVPGIPTGAAVGAVTTLGYGGFLVGPPVIGFIAERTSLALGIGALSLVGIVLTIGSRRLSRIGLENAVVNS